MTLPLENSDSEAAGGAPPISVIIPAYNAAGSLGACLASLANSSQLPCECIVVDDGSTDGTARIAREHGATVIANTGRHGPGFSRNQGAARARGDVLLFLDSDVLVHADALARLAAGFQADASLDAIFGSYDDRPGSPEFLSQYKNLQHCFVHQTARASASTFWSGCGAVRKTVFRAQGGFNGSVPRPAVEDIEFGYRLVRSGGRIMLDHRVLAQHWKRWTLWNLLKTEIVDRGIPWTRLILRDRFMPNDLNLRWSQRISAGLALWLAAALVSEPLFPGAASWIAVCMALLMSLTMLNLPFYRFLASRRGWRFAIAAIPLHSLHHFCNAATFLLTVAYCKLRPRDGAGS